MTDRVEAETAQSTRRTLKPTPLAQATLAIAWKDLRSELRRRELVAAMLVFALLSLLIFSFALEVDARSRAANAAGILWVTLVFAGTLGLGRSLGRERDQGSLEGVLLAPIDRSALYFGKLIGNFLFMIIVAVIIIGPLSVLFGISLFTPLLPLILLLGILGYAGVGTLVASLAAYTRGREILMPILLLPIALSILIPAVRATRAVLEGAAYSDITIWLNLLLATNVVYIVLAYLLFDFIVSE
ncbi:MAG: ABC transporter permease [Chloroflexi bacterium]|nr:ABC transporter permease [Chloroflexota bacterium]